MLRPQTLIYLSLYNVMPRCHAISVLGKGDRGAAVPPSITQCDGPDFRQAQFLAWANNAVACSAASWRKEEVIDGCHIGLQLLIILVVECSTSCSVD